jgi:hypothetical protein
VIPEANGQTSSEPEALASDLIIPALGCGLAAYYVLSTADLAWEARATGSIIASVLLGMCAVHFLRTALRVVRGAGRLGFGDLLEDSSHNRQRLVLLALLVVFVLTIRWLGTTLGLFLLLVGALRVMGVRSARELLAISAAAASAVYLLFIFLLNSRLPRGAIENALATILPALGG